MTLLYKIFCRKKWKKKKITPRPLPPSTMQNKCLNQPTPALLQGDSGSVSSSQTKGTCVHWPFHGEAFARLGTFLSSWNLCKSEATTLGQPLILSHWAFTLPSSGFHSLARAVVVPTVSCTINHRLIGDHGEYSHQSQSLSSLPPPLCFIFFFKFFL